MEQGVSMGTMPAGAQVHMQTVQVPWLEVHAPGGIQVIPVISFPFFTCPPIARTNDSISAFVCRASWQHDACRVLLHAPYPAVA